MEVDLAGGTALVTGDSKGLGLAMATRFAAAGADVAILARRPDALEEAKGVIHATAKGKVAAIACDVSKADAIRTAYDAVLAAIGTVDILINNAGVSRRLRFEDITDEIWQADFDLKLFAAIRLTRLILPHMKERG
jgi:3-oxoacyl-[acyl-carrier protein] reductase